MARHLLIAMTTVLALGVLGSATTQPAGGRLIFEDSFDKGLADWQPEGNHTVEVVDGRLHVKAVQDDRFNGQYVWCRQTLPAAFRIEYDVTPASDSGFFLLFFCTQGVKGEDILDAELFEKYFPHKAWKQYEDWDKYTSPPKRNHDSRIGGYHVSYRRNELANCNLRKNPGLNLLKTTDLKSRLPKGEVAKVALTYEEGRVLLTVNGGVFMDHTDPDKPWSGGRFGFRQVYDSDATYDNVRVWDLSKGP
jgi:hypothetical protein